MKEKDSNFLRRQAELCIALSRSTIDLTLAGRLRGMAEEFRRKAEGCGDEVDDLSRNSGAQDGEYGSRPTVPMA